MDPKTDKLIRRTTLGVTVTAAYFLLTADYGPQENALSPVSVKRAILFPVPRFANLLIGRDKLTPFFGYAELIKRAIESVESSVKKFIFGSDKGARENDKDNTKFNDEK